MILFVNTQLVYPGGTPKFVVRTAERLAQMGLEVGVLTLAARQDIIEEYPSVKYFLLGGPLPTSIRHWLSFPQLMRRVNKVISQLKVHVLFPHAFPASYWAFLYKRQNPHLPCVWYCHEPSSFIHSLQEIRGLKGPVKHAALLSNPLFQLLDRRMARYPDKIVTNSHYTAGRIQKIYKRDAEVLYPVMLDVDAPEPNSEKADFIFTLGVLTRFKKIDVVLNALALIKKRGEAEIPLIVGGEGVEKPNLIKLAQDLELRQVRFAGRLSDEDVKEYLRRARAVVCPATGEAFGQIPLEAMACGTAVLAADSGGHRETVLHGETGLLFKPDDEADLADKLLLLAKDNSLVSRMSLAARQHVEQHFSFDNTVNRLYEIFAPYC